jgi:nucleotide-binding universal stress UspA family protein
MSIVCGTDFSEGALHAATVAGCFAARTRQPLHLVRVLDLRREEVHDPPGHAFRSTAEDRLRSEAERLSKFGANVHVHATAGFADEALRAAAREYGASLLVVGAIGHGGNDARRLGASADRIARQSHVPVLAVRDSAAYVEWLAGERPLRVVLGIDASESAEHAARWLDEVCHAGAVELVLAHLYWPPEAFSRFGLGGIRSFVEPDPELVKALESQLSKRFDPALDAELRSYRIEPHLGRLGDALAGLAAEARADLLVVGSRAQNTLERLWGGSVPRQVLSAASMSVACVPSPAAARPLHIPRLERVLVATDFSELGNGAVPIAYAAVSPGGTVHLVHVLDNGHGRVDADDIFKPSPKESTSQAALAARAHLSRLIPLDANTRRAASEVVVLAAHDAGQAICQAAERLGVDLIALGTHGRTGLARAALGSVAAHVLMSTRRPLLMARGPKP